MATVRVEPLGIDLEVPPHEALMDAAESAGYEWPTICGGVGMCTLCWVRVDAGLENLGPMHELEREALTAYRSRKGALDPRIRLGCQLTVTGDVTVFKRGVDVTGRAGMYR